MKFFECKNTDGATCWIAVDAVEMVIKPSRVSAIYQVWLKGNDAHITMKEFPELPLDMIVEDYYEQEIRAHQDAKLK